jgi:hypothetical protein
MALITDFGPIRRLTLRFEVFERHVDQVKRQIVHRQLPEMMEQSRVLITLWRFLLYDGLVFGGDERSRSIAPDLWVVIARKPMPCLNETYARVTT